MKPRVERYTATVISRSSVYNRVCRVEVGCDEVCEP